MRSVDEYYQNGSHYGDITDRSRKQFELKAKLLYFAVEFDIDLLLSRNFI